MSFENKTNVRKAPMQRNYIKVLRVTVMLFLCGVAVNANATSGCYQWWMTWDGGAYFYSGLLSSAQEVSDNFVAYCNSRPYGTGATESDPNTSCSTACNSTNVTSCVWRSLPVVYTVFPSVNTNITITVQSIQYGSPVTNTYNFVETLNTTTNPAGCQTYISSLFPPQAMCGSCVQAPVGHPINTATGAVYDSMADVNSSGSTINFKRFYNSANTAGVDLSGGWQHSYTRNVKPHYSSTDYRPYVTSPDNSSLYNDEATACTSGFTEIQGRVAAWAGATATYANGACVISKGSNTVATLPILYTSPPTPAPGTSTLIGYNVTRDDGQLVSFVINGTSLVAPAGISLQLQQTSTGFTVTDANDNVEQYDTTGKLLTVTSRSGVVQTMSYDSSGHLSNISDSFGHQLILNYNTQNQLSSVTRQ